MSDLSEKDLRDKESIYSPWEKILTLNDNRNGILIFIALSTTRRTFAYGKLISDLKIILCEGEATKFVGLSLLRRCGYRFDPFIAICIETRFSKFFVVYMNLTHCRITEDK